MYNMVNFSFKTMIDTSKLLLRNQSTRIYIVAIFSKNVVLLHMQISEIVKIIKPIKHTYFYVLN